MGGPPEKGRYRILSISNKKQPVAVYVYTAVAAFCILFNYIYSLYAHGVSSDFMTYMFLLPLVGGSLVFAGLRMLHNRVKAPSRLSFNLYNSGVAWLTVGSCVTGVIEIAGYESDYINVYLVIGLSFVLAGIFAYVMQNPGEKPLNH